MHIRNANIPQLLKISSEGTQENKQIGFWVIYYSELPIIFFSLQIDSDLLLETS